MSSLPNRLARILVLLGAIVVFATAVFHGTGYRPLTDALTGTELDEFFKRGLPALWLMFSFQLVALALAGTWVALRSPPGARAVLALSAALLAIDVLLLAIYVGLFSGTLVLALGAVATLAGTILWPGGGLSPDVDA